MSVEPPLVDEKYRLYRAAISLQHWQLRNLIMVPESEWGFSVLYPEMDVITSLDLVTDKREAVVKMGSVPRCLRVYKDIIVCGGVRDSGDGPPQGIVSVYTKGAATKSTHQVGEEINNSVFLYVNRTGPGCRGVLCNNDHLLYAGTVTNTGWQTDYSLDFGMPVNQCAVAPDAKTMAVCGDYSSVRLCHLDEPSNQWAKVASLRTAGDVGIAVAFSPTGTNFTAAFQDGSAYVYDLRQLSSPLHVLHSTRPGSSPRVGAFRACLYADTMHDLLFLSEGFGRVHLVDTRNFANHQVLRLPPSSHEYASKTVQEPAPQELAGPRPVPVNSRFEEESEQDTRGLAWSTLNGGSLVVGSTRGIAVYNCPKRNVFSSVELR